MPRQPRPVKYRMLHCTLYVAPDNTLQYQYSKHGVSMCLSLICECSDPERDIFRAIFKQHSLEILYSQELLSRPWYADKVKD